jgi:hypothetical protein
MFRYRAIKIQAFCRICASKQRNVTTPGVITVKENSTFCRKNGASIYVQFPQPSMKELQAPDRNNLEPFSSSKKSY